MNQVGNALRVSANGYTNSPAYVTYYFDTNQCQLCRVTNGVATIEILAQNLTNASRSAMQFQAQQFNGSLAQDWQFKYMIVATIEFCQYQYPLTRWGPAITTIITASRYWPARIVPTEHENHLHIPAPLVRPRAADRHVHHRRQHDHAGGDHEPDHRHLRLQRPQQSVLGGPLRGGSRHRESCEHDENRLSYREPGRHYQPSCPVQTRSRFRPRTPIGTTSNSATGRAT